MCIRDRLDTQPVAFVKQRGQAAHLDGDDPVAAESRMLSVLKGLAVVPVSYTHLTLPTSDLV